MASYQRLKTRESSHVTAEVNGCQFVLTSNDLFTVVMQDHISIIIFILFLEVCFFYLFVQLYRSLDHAHMLQVHVVVPSFPSWTLKFLSRKQSSTVDFYSSFPLSQSPSFDPLVSERKLGTQCCFPSCCSAFFINCSRVDNILGPNINFSYLAL